MMISSKQVNDILQMNSMQIHKISGASIEIAKTGKHQVNDQLSISESSKMRSIALSALQQVADVRFDKVEALKQQMATGTYKVSDSEIAEKMISRVLTDELF